MKFRLIVAHSGPYGHPILFLSTSAGMFGRVDRKFEKRDAVWWNGLEWNELE